MNVLQPGNRRLRLRTIEPLVYRTPYGFGMQNKDMVLVTQTGSELLSDYADTDKLLVVR